MRTICLYIDETVHHQTNSVLCMHDDPSLKMLTIRMFDMFSTFTVCDLDIHTLF